MLERNYEHSFKDVNPFVSKHSIETDHPTVPIDDFRVLRTGYRQKKIRRKFSEALFIKQNKHAFNKQETSVSIKSFK